MVLLVVTFTEVTFRSCALCRARRVTIKQNTGEDRRPKAGSFCADYHHLRSSIGSAATGYKWLPLLTQLSLRWTRWFWGGAALLSLHFSFPRIIFMLCSTKLNFDCLPWLDWLSVNFARFQRLLERLIYARKVISILLMILCCNCRRYSIFDESFSLRIFF